MLNDDIFTRCSEINDKLNEGCVSEARAMVIKLLDCLEKDNDSYMPLINHLVREVGLYPYMNPETSNWEDRFAYEAFKTDIGEDKKYALHLDQSLVLKRLLLGDSIAVSAPTSFGKSFIIDAYIAIKRPNIVVDIVPTVALADETRRRLTHKFGDEHKIITTTDATVAEKSIFVFPQERAFAYIQILEVIDILIVDEFYKASAKYDDSRSSTLLNTMIELGKKAKQRYYLAPNISELPDNVFTEGMEFLKLDFKTVVTQACKMYRKKPQDVDMDTFKRETLRQLARQDIGKTLIYAGTYSNISTVCDILKDSLPERNSKILNAFSEWIAKNYGSHYRLHSLVKKGIGIHNGQMHRSLSQLQVKLFERADGLTNMVSTSSIIEGVNTQAENVILWSVKNGVSSIDYFTYRNIIGRAGRMFRYFVGKVYLLEMPPETENTTLELEFPDDVARSLDGNNPGIRLNNLQFQLIKSFQDEMAALLSPGIWSVLYNNPQIKSCNPTLLKAIVLKIKQDSNWPRNYDALTRRKPWDWRTAIEDVIDIANIRRKGQVKTYTCLASNGWSMTIPYIYEQVSKYGITMEDMFDFERKISFNLASVLSIINIIKQAIYPNTPDVSDFVHRASNAFLPKLVFQLEEYGLPRMISKKIHSSRMINLEDDSIEISTIIDKFKEIGLDNLLVSVKGLDAFDKYIIKYFYQGIG